MAIRGDCDKPDPVDIVSVHYVRDVYRVPEIMQAVPRRRLGNNMPVFGPALVIYLRLLRHGTEPHRDAQIVSVERRYGKKAFGHLIQEIGILRGR